MTQDEQKRAAALAAVDLIGATLSFDTVVGVGTGSTADHFIDALAQEKGRFRGAVASSKRSAERLSAHGIEVIDLNSIDCLPVYVDGADEITVQLVMIKGGGLSLTREKIVAVVAGRFVCIADETKLVEKLGSFPLPIDVIPIAHAHVARELATIARRLGFRSDIRLKVGPRRSDEDVPALPLSTDDGNYILEVHGWTIEDPVALEVEINSIAGVVANGIFARRPADCLLLGTQEGVKRFDRARFALNPDASS